MAFFAIARVGLVGPLPIHPVCVASIWIELDLYLGADLTASGVHQNDVPGDEIATDGDVIIAQVHASFADYQHRRIPLV